MRINYITRYNKTIHAQEKFESLLARSEFARAQDNIPTMYQSVGERFLFSSYVVQNLQPFSQVPSITIMTECYNWISEGQCELGVILISTNHVPIR